MTPALQERELATIAALSDAIAAALEDRGVPPLHAALAAPAAQVGMTAIAHAQIEWLNDKA